MFLKSKQSSRCWLASQHTGDCTAMCNLLCIRALSTVWRDDFFSSAPHCPAAYKGIEWLSSMWTVHRNLIPEKLSPTEYLNIQGGREQQQEKGVYKVRSKDERSKTAGNRPQKSVFHSLSPCKKNCLPTMNSLLLRDMAILQLFVLMN